MPFPLVRYFGLTSLLFFIAVSGVLGYYYREMALSGMLQQQESGNCTDHGLCQCLVAKTFSDAGRSIPGN